MKKKKRISIKNPKLRNLRNNLRKVLLLAVEDDIKLNIDLRKSLLEESKVFVEPSEQYTFIKDDSSTLIAKSHELYRLERSSICKCPICSRIDQDMIFIPDENLWFCTECYDNGALWWRKTPNY